MFGFNDQVSLLMWSFLISVPKYSFHETYWKENKPLWKVNLVFADPCSFSLWLGAIRVMQLYFYQSQDTVEGRVKVKSMERNSKMIVLIMNNMSISEFVLVVQYFLRERKKNFSHHARPQINGILFVLHLSCWSEPFLFI